MNHKQVSLLVCIGIAVLCLCVGGIVLEAMIAGIITFISLIALIEAVPLLKWIISHTSKLVDCAIFAFGVYAKIHFGVTIAIGIMFAGLMFTLLYGPYIRDTYKLNKNNRGNK